MNTFQYKSREEKAARFAFPLYRRLSNQHPLLQPTTVLQLLNFELGLLISTLTNELF